MVLELLRWDRHNDIRVWTVHHGEANSHNFQILFAEGRAHNKNKGEERAFPMLSGGWFSPQILVSLQKIPWYCLAGHCKWMNCLILQAAVTFYPFNAETWYMLSICRLHEKVERNKTKPVLQKCDSKNLSEQVFTTQLTS